MTAEIAELKFCRTEIIFVLPREFLFDHK